MWCVDSTGLQVRIYRRRRRPQRRFYGRRPQRGFYPGTVEVNRYGFWGPVCNSSWDDRDANATCHGLGYVHGIPYYGSAAQGNFFYECNKTQHSELKLFFFLWFQSNLSRDLLLLCSLNLLNTFLFRPVFRQQPKLAWLFQTMFWNVHVHFV